MRIFNVLILGVLLTFLAMADELTEDACVAAIVAGDPVPDGCPGPASEQASDTAAAATLHKLDPNCPDPTSKQGSQCVLDHDVTLGQTIALESGTHLNCKGHKILPEYAGTPELAAWCSLNKQKHCVNNNGCINTATVKEGTCTFDPKEYVRSKPELGVLVLGAYGVKLQNCIIGDSGKPFDFGVLVLDAKIPNQLDAGLQAQLRNKILGNTVSARYGGISTVKADGNEIADNNVTFAIGAHGRGIAINRDSDRNRVANNTIRAHSVDVFTLIPNVPQGPLGANNSRGIHSAAFNFGVLNFVYYDPLMQRPPLTQIEMTEDMIIHPADSADWFGTVPGTWLGQCNRTTKRCSGDPMVVCRDSRDCSLGNDSMTSDWLSEDNIYEGNFIDYGLENKLGFGNAANNSFGIVVVGSRGGEIRNNFVANANEGIHFGSNAHAGMIQAGKCSGDSTRWCGVNADCKIEGFDLVSKGTCGGPLLRVYTAQFEQADHSLSALQNTVNIGAKGVVVRNNILVANDQGIALSRGAQKINLIGNDITGSIGSGISVRENAVDTETFMSRNKIHSNRFGITWDRGVSPSARSFMDADSFNARMTLNDLVGNERGPQAIGVCSSFPFALSCIEGNTDDCDNSCAPSTIAGDPEGFKRCKKLQKPCSTDVDCNGVFNGAPSLPANSACVRAFSFANSELSYLERGNYWGHTAEEGAFTAADTPDFNIIKDSCAYGVPVADMPEELLPATCSN